MAECNACLYNPVCELWREAECQDACSYLTGGLADCPIYKPSSDVVEVRNGYWDYDTNKCSVCGSWMPDDGFWPSPYCPTCGATMAESGDGE